MTKADLTLRAVEILREQFRGLIPACEGTKGLAARLSKVNTYFSTVKGYNDVKNAKRNKAGEVAMTHIINAMQEYISAQKATSNAQGAVKKSLDRMNVVAASHARQKAAVQASSERRQKAIERNNPREKVYKSTKQ